MTTFAAGAGAVAFLVAFIAFIAFTAFGMVKGNGLARRLIPCKLEPKSGVDLANLMPTMPDVSQEFLQISRQTNVGFHVIVDRVGVL